MIFVHNLCKVYKFGYEFLGNKHLPFFVEIWYNI